MLKQGSLAAGRNGAISPAAGPVQQERIGPIEAERPGDLGAGRRQSVAPCEPDHRTPAIETIKLLSSCVCQPIGWRTPGTHYQSMEWSRWRTSP
jgi:hypothetical protein